MVVQIYIFPILKFLLEVYSKISYANFVVSLPIYPEKANGYARMAVRDDTQIGSSIIIDHNFTKRKVHKSSHSLSTTRKLIGNMFYYVS